LPWNQKYQLTCPSLLLTALSASFATAELTKSTAYASSPPSASVRVAFAGKMPTSVGFVAVLTSSASIIVTVTSASRTSIVTRFAATRLRITIMVLLSARTVAERR